MAIVSFNPTPTTLYPDDFTMPLRTPICLSLPTRTELHKRQDLSEAQLLTPIVCDASNTVLGLNTGSAIPSSLVLPSGLRWAEPQSDILDRILSKTDPTTSLALLPLHYFVRLSLTSTQIDQTVSKLSAASLLTVSGKAVQPHQTLSDVLPYAIQADRTNAHIVRLYTATSVTTPTAPVFRTAVLQSDALVVGVKALAYASPSASGKEVIRLICESVRRVLEAVFIVSKKGHVSISHYRVLGDGIAVTMVIPSEECENEESEKAITRRQGIHTALCLPMDRPLLRQRQGVYSSERQGKELTDGGFVGRLRDVHIGIKSHGMGEEGVEIGMVDGSYLYCHYLQGKLNDSGWGCAYRSLQTLISWAVFEGYASFEDDLFPGHKRIQTALVEVGDKAASFIGSKEWIGANEVCYAMQKLVGIDSKILHVSKGSEMESRARELLMHFEQEGSPVMVGGGVLAWTILGVVRNTKTGKAKFLILDPHYEGKDQLGTIQGKGWVAWKSADVFVSSAFYNLCMPMRPVGV